MAHSMATTCTNDPGTWSANKVRQMVHVNVSAEPGTSGKPIELAVAMTTSPMTRPGVTTSPKPLV
ncbi:hypothetical protein GQ600_2009 [Phytophthora cactorum]|nr:hypothetical protein GQ600_2009 [Phytophthora cactorum]